MTYINLREKPDWFLALSPHGKVPVLQVDEQPLFESNAIAEYLEETVEPRMHPEDPIKRARNRAWTDFVPEFSRALGTVSYAGSKEALDEAMEKAPNTLVRLEEAIINERDNDGPYFNGPSLSLVDASYAPFLQRFSIAERILQTGLLKVFPRMQNWTAALLENEAVKHSVPDEFYDTFDENLARRGTYASQLQSESGCTSS